MSPSSDWTTASRRERTAIGNALRPSALVILALALVTACDKLRQSKSPTEPDLPSAPQLVQEGNRPPVADAGGPYDAEVGEKVRFDGSGSSDPEGGQLSFAWDFGDGETGSGEKVGHMYDREDEFTVTLTVTDDRGDTASDTAKASISKPDVENVRPVAKAGGSYSGIVGEPIQFDGSGSHDPDGEIVSYAWEWGDGSEACDKCGAKEKHTYLREGDVTVTLTVTDDRERKSLPDSAAVKVRPPGVNLPPHAVIGGPYSGLVGQEIQFDGQSSEDPDGKIESYQWDFGDGAKGSVASPTHAYSEVGEFPVTLTVTDNDGEAGTAQTTATITKENQPPNAVIGAPDEGVQGEELMFDGSASTDDDSITTYSWDFGDGNSESSSQEQITHTYSESGPFTVTLTVTDDKGAKSQPATANLGIKTFYEARVHEIWSTVGPDGWTGGCANCHDDYQNHPLHLHHAPSEVCKRIHEGTCRGTEGFCCPPNTTCLRYLDTANCQKSAVIFVPSTGPDGKNQKHVMITCSSDIENTWCNRIRKWCEHIALRTIRNPCP